MHKKIERYLDDESVSPELFSIKNTEKIILEADKCDEIFDLKGEGFFSKIQDLLESIKEEEKLSNNFYRKRKGEREEKAAFLKKFDIIDFQTDKLTYYVNALRKKKNEGIVSYFQK